MLSKTREGEMERATVEETTGKEKLAERVREKYLDRNKRERDKDSSAPSEENGKVRHYPGTF
jgi:hypothetical protein